MTETKPAEFSKGDKVTSKNGDKLVVINQGHPGGAVHAESAPGEKPYINTHFAADSLKKGAAAKKAAAAKKDETSSYVVTFKTDQDAQYLVEVEATDEETAVAAATQDDSHTEGDEVVSVEKSE